MKKHAVTDDQLEEKDEFVEEGDAESQTDELRAELEAALAAKEHAEDAAQRALADYQNVVRRSQEERAKVMKLAGRDMAMSILLPLDHLYLAKEQLRDHGLNMIYQQFMQALQGQGIQEIPAVGQPFDENTMEVIDKRDVTDELQDNVVLSVTQRGYTLHGEVIRHAKVVIGVFSASSADQKE